MIYMTHNSNYGRAFFFTHFAILFHFPIDNIHSVFIFKAVVNLEFIANHFQRVLIQALIHRYQLTHHKELGNNLGGRNIHNFRQLTNRGEFSDDNFVTAVFHILGFPVVFFPLRALLQGLFNISGNFRFIHFNSFN
ncbi:MAG: hypothetical protein BWX76_00695 [Candidatus Cloacimonetes bacterium ADurb.Bin089]|nr:MAG: hypothetical protein BWX76_00695 [Candidatus Cloacimonetes bacterium ADurb.Bin089]